MEFREVAPHVETNISTTYQLAAEIIINPIQAISVATIDKELLFCSRFPSKMDD